MGKKTAAIDRKARLRPSAVDTARARRADIAYRTYVLKALRRFDLEGRLESTGQARERMFSFLGLEPERAYRTQPTMAVGEHAPKRSTEN